jgi:hypothetical protein
MNKSYKKIYTDINHHVVDKQMAYKGKEKNKVIKDYNQYNCHFLNQDLISFIIFLLQDDVVTLYQLYLTSHIFHPFIKNLKDIVIKTNYTFQYYNLFNHCCTLYLENQRYDYKDYTLKNHLYKKLNHLYQFVSLPTLKSIHILDCRFNKTQMNKLIKIIQLNSSINHIAIDYFMQTKYKLNSTVIFQLFIVNHLKTITINNVLYHDYFPWDQFSLYWDDQWVIDIYLNHFIKGPSADFFTLYHFKQCQIEKLTMTHCRIDNYYFLRLMLFLCQTPIQYINLCHNHITHDYGDMIYRCLQLFKNLKYLILSGNQISDGQLAKWRRANANITILI